MPTAFELPNDHLTRKLLHTNVTPLLEFLCTDSLYTFKDDFDKDDLSDYWGVAASLSGRPVEDVANFHFEDGAVGGWLEGDPGKVDNVSIRLFSRRALWQPARRCVMQVSFELASFSSVRVETGFVNPFTPIDDISYEGAVLVKATPTANDESGFAVAVLDTDDNTSCDLVIQTNGALAAADQSGPSVLTAPGRTSIMVAMTEGGGTRYWLNGIPSGLVHIAAHTPSLGATTGLNPVSGDHVASANMHLWFSIQNRSTDQIHNCRIDYMQAWQERVPV